MPTKLYQPSKWNCTTCILNKNKESTKSPARRLMMLSFPNVVPSNIWSQIGDEPITKIEIKTETNQQCAGVKQFSAEQCLPSFINHPNGILLCVLKKSYTPALLETKNILGPSFICHPNRIVLGVLNQQRFRLKSLSGAAVISKREILHALKRK